MIPSSGPDQHLLSPNSAECHQRPLEPLHKRAALHGTAIRVEALVRTYALI